MIADSQIYNEDCIAGMAGRLEESSVDLCVSSIPFGALFSYSGKTEDIGNNQDGTDLRAGQFGLHMRFFCEQLFRVLKPGRNACIHIQQLLRYKVQHGYIGRRDFRGAVVDLFCAGGFEWKGEAAIPKNPQAMAQRLNLHSLMFATVKRNSLDLAPAVNDYVMVFQKPGEPAERVACLHDPAENPGGWVTTEEWIKWASGCWDDIRETDVLDGYRSARENDEEKHVCPLQLEVIPKLVEAVLADKAAKGKSESYQQDLKNRLERFAKDYQEIKASQVTTEMLEDWLTGLGIGPTSRNNYRRLLKLAMNYALRKGWVAANVARNVEIAKEVGGEVEALTVDECRALLDSATPEALPVLAIGLFAGIRPFEIMRLEWSALHWDERGEGEIDAPAETFTGDINISPDKAKTAQRRLVVIRPNLAAFLASYRDRQGPIYPAGKWAWYRYLPTLREAARLTRWPADALRHTFCSMDLAHFNDANALALRMGHTDTQLIFTRYRRVVKASEAARFWNLLPTHQP